MLEVRLVCAATWLLLALALHTRGPERAQAPAWTWCGLAIAADLTRWHAHLWRATRELLRSTGLYEQRVVGKAVIGLLVVLLLARVVPGLLRASQGSARVRLGLLAAAGWTGWLLAWTAFLDDLLPAAFGEPVLRYGLELAWAAVPLVVLARGRTA